MKAQCEYRSVLLPKACGGSSEPHVYCEGCGWLCRICTRRPCSLTGCEHVLLPTESAPIQKLRVPVEQGVIPFPAADKSKLPIQCKDEVTWGELHAAMTFDQIGAVLGLTRQRVQQIYIEAMEKIRSNPEEVRKLQDLVELRSSMHRVWDDLWNRGEEAAA